MLSNEAINVVLLIYLISLRQISITPRLSDSSFFLRLITLKCLFIDVQNNNFNFNRNFKNYDLRFSRITSQIFVIITNQHFTCNKLFYVDKSQSQKCIFGTTLKETSISQRQNESTVAEVVSITETTPHLELLIKTLVNPRLSQKPNLSLRPLSLFYFFFFSLYSSRFA